MEINIQIWKFYSFMKSLVSMALHAHPYLKVKYYMFIFVHENQPKNSHKSITSNKFLG